MPNSIESNGYFFALALSDHKVLGATYSAHILKLLSAEGGIYSVVDNLFPDNMERWSGIVPADGHRVVKVLDEISDSTMFRVIGKSKKNIADFYKQVQSDEVFGNYVKAYFERRIAKCVDLIISGNLPVFLKDKKFNNLYHDNLLQFERSLAHPVFRFTVTPTETQYKLEAVCNGEGISLKQRSWQVVTNEPCIIRLGQRVLRFEGIDAKKLMPFFLKDYVSIPKSAERKYFETFVLNSIRNQIVSAEGFTVEELSPPFKPILSLEKRLSGDLGLVLYFKYGEKKYLAHTKPQREVTLLELDDKYHFRCYGRNQEQEEKARTMLLGQGLVNAQGAEYCLVDSVGDYDAVEWLNRNYDYLVSIGFVIEQVSREVLYYLKGFDLDLKAKLENDWFDVYGKVSLNSYEFPFLHLRKNIIKGIPEFVLPNGEIFVIPSEWFAKYKALFSVGRVENDKLLLGKSGFAHIALAGVESPQASDLKKRFESEVYAGQCSLPTGLKAELRDYQKLGLFWLQLLNECGMGGCLADDMGLGKTIQTLALLLYNLQANSKERVETESVGLQVMGRTSLLVVPTSLLFNWQREVSRFAPSLTMYQFTGPNRTRSAATLIGYDIVITTYGVLRNDIDMLKDIRFSYVVLDESQTIKNPASKVYRSAMLLKARNFLSLSGTPIENSLTDLWAQLNFLNRGMLGTLRSFSEEFIVPIEKNNDPEVQERLKALVQPFIMRRSKQEVAPELPEVTEQVVFCSLTEDQKSIYEKEKSIIRNGIMESIDSLGYSGSVISILRGLTRLRQISNHPQLIDEYMYADSGKFEEVIRTIEAVVGEGHKVLVFSSFVKHLRLVEKHLLNAGIGYQMLTGATTGRQQVVDEFQNNTENQVFLISIKAGGVGLNLTAADYILILDPWWNPAVENQAIARAHRIGQDKPVFVYRFISVDTVEEKIQRLQERKLLLTEQFVNNSNPLSVISKEQILDILS